MWFISTVEAGLSSSTIFAALAGAIASIFGVLLKIVWADKKDYKDQLIEARADNKELVDRVFDIQKETAVILHETQEALSTAAVALQASKAETQRRRAEDRRNERRQGQ